MASSTVENYLKQIYLEQQSVGADLVPMGRLATAMAVTPGTATTMIKALAEANLVAYEARAGSAARSPRPVTANPITTSFGLHISHLFD